MVLYYMVNVTVVTTYQSTMTNLLSKARTLWLCLCEEALLALIGYNVSVWLAQAIIQLSSPHALLNRIHQYTLHSSRWKVACD